MNPAFPPDRAVAASWSASDWLMTDVTAKTSIKSR
jgi:hypothetical protein